MKTKIISTLTVIAVLLSCFFTVSADTAKHKDTLQKTAEYVKSVVTEPTFGNEWVIIGLSRSGMNLNDSYFSGYYEKVVEAVKSTINEKEQLSSTKSTENSRLILALSCIGKNAADVGGHNLIKGLSDLDYIKSQGANGSIWALIAVDSNNYEIPQADDGVTQTTRDALIETILGKKLTNGGWTYFGTSPDPDLTAMAIQSLAPYYNKSSDVKSAVDEAVELLSTMQNENGGYTSWGSESPESCAQVIVALTALGVNPDTDTRFVKNGKSLVDAVLSFKTAENGFSHTKDAGVNQMATEQSFYSIVAFDRFLSGKTSLYNATDNFSNNNNNNNNNNGNKPSNGSKNNDGKKPTNSKTRTTDTSKKSPKTGYDLAYGFCFLTLALSGATALKTRKSRA